MHYATGGRLASVGLTIRPNVEEAAREYVGACASCGEAQAPLGIDSKHELAQWAGNRTRLAPVEGTTAAERAATSPNSRHDACPVCNAQLIAVIGLPMNILEPFLDGLDGYWRPRMCGFLETRFVFLLCNACANSTAELHITEKEIATRYAGARAAFAQRHFDVAPSYADAIAERVFQRIGMVIQARDRATA